MRTLLGAILALVLTAAVFGTIYVVAQQLQRGGATDDARRAASSAADGSSPTPAGFDLSTRLDPFAMVFDTSGRPVDDPVQLAGSQVAPPTGVIRTAARSGSDAVTWQPNAGLRFALYAERVGDRVVVGGVSLQPTEARIDDLVYLVGAPGLVTAIVAAGGVLGIGAVTRRPAPRSPSA